MEQLSLFPAALRVGAYIEEHGRRLAWDELQVGMTVIYDCSTESHEWLMVTTVEKIIRTPDDLRVIWMAEESKGRSSTAATSKAEEQSCTGRQAHERTGSAGDTGAAV